MKSLTVRRLALLILMMLSLNSEAVLGQTTREVANGLGMKFARIPSGSFRMGSPLSDLGRWDNEVEHWVTISEAFHLGCTEVTQAEYQEVMDENPSHFQGDRLWSDSRKHPVEQVSWDEAVEFCRCLSDLPEEKAAGRVYRLPTEAEWEYACRAGTGTRFFFGEKKADLRDYAWFADHKATSNHETHPVGKKQPNAWGLYDMYGNVNEWCSDWYGAYPEEPVIDPKGPNAGSGKVVRGGAYCDISSLYRSAKRSYCPPFEHRKQNGFRVVLTFAGVNKQ